VTGSAANLLLVQPFPAPGQLVALAYRELDRAATGTPEQIRALGDARLLPRPWEPASCSTPQLRQQLWCWLEEVVEWLVAEYAAERLGIGRTVMYALVSSGAAAGTRRRPGHAWLLKLSAWEDVGRRSGRTERQRNSRGTDRGPSFAVAPPGLGPPDPWEAYCRPHWCSRAARRGGTDPVSSILARGSPG
jgi:hypothetical protein